MTRDYDLIIKILRYYEQRGVHQIDEEPRLEGYDNSAVQYHLLLMFQAGLLDAEASFSKSTPTRAIKVYPFGLSWEGHEFLSAAQDDTVIQKAKEKAGGELSGLPFSVMKDLLWAILKDQLGLA